MGLTVSGCFHKDKFTFIKGFSTGAHTHWGACKLFASVWLIKWRISLFPASLTSSTSKAEWKRNETYYKCIMQNYNQTECES